MNLPNGSEILIESLERQNAKVIFGVPGGVLLPLYDALYKGDLRHVLVRHEQAAAFAADGYARVTGQPGVCVGTSGPGATNLITGLASAFMDSIPVVALTGQVTTDMIGKDAFQEGDTIGISMPVTKHSFAVRTAGEIPDVIRQAFQVAVSGRPGPVLVDLPKTALVERADPDFASEPLVSQPERLKEWRDTDIERAATMILESRRAVLYVGGGVISSGATDELRVLAELTGIPVTTTLMGLGAFPSRHPLSLGMLGMHGSYATNLSICHSDLLVAVGARFDDRATGRVKDFASQAKKIHIDVDPSEINKNVRVDLPLVGDAREILRALIGEVGGQIRRGRRVAHDERRKWLEQIESWRTEHPLNYDREASCVKPQYLIEVLSEQAEPDAIVSVDVGQHQMWAAQFYRFSQPRSWLSSSGLGSMGYGFPAAMGAQVAFPDRQVIAIVGDGGFQMTLSDLATVSEYGIPVKIVVVNNRSLGMVRQWQHMFFDKHYCDVSLGRVPDFVKLAEAYGISGARVERRVDLKDAVADFLSGHEPRLLDVRVDPEENVFPIVPPGASLAEMLVEPPVLVDKK
ncbi:MAG TPA: biosynthetic-type acetolactate synthase large subunit [Terriglobia bacterium]|nr:biosynthetic-type acetolactate synthase large subunit [Terriglobia bacterium]